jgi:hypothetical protein
MKSRIMRWVGHVASMGEGRGVYRGLVEKSEERGPLGRLRLRWENNFKMDVGCEGMDWIGLAQGRNRWRVFMNAVMDLRVP